jgi:HK97 family phage prohead protease
MATSRPMVGQVEERQAPALEVDGRKIRGKIPYGVESRDLGGFREVIEAGALNQTQLDDLVVTVDHVGLPLGRYPGTLELEDRSDGLHWSVDPPKSREDIREAVERGDLKAGSWRMVVGRDEWRGDVRHVLEIAQLRDVSVVTRPAYDAASVELRSAEDNDGAVGHQKEGKGMAEEANKEGGLQVEDRHVKQDDESYPAGSLRVEDRTVDVDIRMRTLADLYADHGFFENRVARIGWDEYRSFTWAAGTVLTDLNPVRAEGVPLGYDARWLYPVLPTTAVDNATTAVQYLRQSSRSLAGTAVIRPIDATSTKPESSTTVEFKTLQLEQVATVSSGIPRIHAAQPLFQSLVEQDLRLAINDGLDEVVRRGVVQAGTIVKGTDDILEVTRKAMTLVQADGYNPNVLAIDPAGAQALDLLRTPGTEKFYLWGPGRATPIGPFGLQIRVWKQAGTAVLDANAYGRLYVAPVELASFEADGGLTNKQNVRMETNAGYTVERIPAARRIT